MNEDYDFSNLDDFGDAESVQSDLEPEHRLAGGAALAIVDTDEGVRNYLEGLFEGAVDSASTLTEMEPQLGLASRVVVLGPSCAGPSDLAIVEQWSRTFPNVATVLVTPELTTQLLHKALRAGVKDVLSAPIDQPLLIETVDRIADSLPVASQMVVGGDDQAPMSDGEVGRVISVFSTKGGSGKSVCATNLASVLARRSDAPVVLIDGHMQFGDVAVMMKLQPEHTAVDAIAVLDQNDPESIMRLMSVHEPTGLLVLPAPLEPTFADQITGEQVKGIISAARRFAGHVIIDLPAIFNEVVLSSLELSDDIVLVAGLDIPNIKNLKIGLSTLSLLSIPDEKLHLVLNRSNSKVKLDVGEVERTIGLDAATHVPSDVVVPISVNRGSPVVLSAQKSGVARAFEQLALRFLDGAAAESAGSSSKRKFFG